jgi:UDP-N-acetylglucosamine 2-epimerase (non-hydrolysing)
MATALTDRHALRRRVLAIVGARPNFVKVAPLIHALTDWNDIDVEILHTGQHYDRALSDSFIERLGMPTPDHCLGVGSGTHAEQTAAVMVGVERVLLADQFDALIVPGDVNSTVGAALAASKLGVPVAHLESGLRSGDRTMPEEINRIVTDRLSDVLLCHCEDAVENLLAEGTAEDAIALVGNTMIDSLYRLLPDARATGALTRYGLAARGYVLATLHRPALVDDPEQLSAVIDVLVDLAGTLPVVLPLHPRTRARLGDVVDKLGERLVLTEPLEYLEFVALEAGARLAITDSGGVQEETSALGVPCLTYRNNTERPVTISLGTNRLVGVDPGALAIAAREALAQPAGTNATPIPLWDGRAGVRAAEAIARLVDARDARDAALGRAA